MSLSRNYYQGIERNLFGICDHVCAGLPPLKRAEMAALIDDGQYGAAVERMAAELADVDEPGTNALTAQILDLADLAGVRDSAAVVGLQRQARESN